MPAEFRELAPGTLLTVECRNDHRRLVGRIGVGIDGGGRLGSEISHLGVKVQRADAMRALLARELHAALDPFNSIGFHFKDCSCPRSKGVDAMVGQRR